MHTHAHLICTLRETKWCMVVSEMHHAAKMLKYSQTMSRTATHRSQVTVSGQIGEIKTGEFLLFTNFVFETDNAQNAVSSLVEACIKLYGFLYKTTMTSGV